MERQRTRQPPEPKRVVAATKASPCAAKPAGYRRPACRQQQCCTTLRGTLRTYASSSCRKLAPAASSVGPCNLQRRTPAVVAAAAPHAKRGGGRLVASPRVILALPALPALALSETGGAERIKRWPFRWQRSLRKMCKWYHAGKRCCVQSLLPTLCCAAWRTPCTHPRAAGSRQTSLAVPACSRPCAHCSALARTLPPCLSTRLRCSMWWRR
jgi:hypothetical protein